MSLARFIWSIVSCRKMTDEKNSNSSILDLMKLPVTATTDDKSSQLDFGICLKHCPLYGEHLREWPDGSSWGWFCRRRVSLDGEGRKTLRFLIVPPGQNSYCCEFRISMPCSEFNKSRMVSCLLKGNGFYFHGRFLKIVFNAIESGMFDDSEAMLYADEKGEVRCPLCLEHCILSGNCSDA